VEFKGDKVLMIFHSRPIGVEFFFYSGGPSFRNRGGKAFRNFEGKQRKAMNEKKPYGD